MDPKIAAQQINKIIERIIRLEDEIFLEDTFPEKNSLEKSRNRHIKGKRHWSKKDTVSH